MFPDYTEKENVTLKDLEYRYKCSINKADWDTKYPYYISNSFSREFGPGWSCYEIGDAIRKAKVVRKGTLEDHEYCCCYYNFKTKVAAESFAKRLAMFIFNRKGE